MASASAQPAASSFGSRASTRRAGRPRRGAQGSVGVPDLRCVRSLRTQAVRLRTARHPPPQSPFPRGVSRFCAWRAHWLALASHLALAPCAPSGSAVDAHNRSGGPHWRCARTRRSRAAVPSGRAMEGALRRARGPRAPGWAGFGSPSWDCPAAWQPGSEAGRLACYPAACPAACPIGRRPAQQPTHTSALHCSSDATASRCWR